MVVKPVQQETSMTDTKKYGSPLESHPNWKGGRTVTSHGYVKVKAPDHPAADSQGYVYEHRLVAEEHLGRRLESDEHVHHIDGDGENNEWDNLEVAHETEHLREHHYDSDRRGPNEPNPTIECACGCGETLKKYDDWGRPRGRLVGHTENTPGTPAREQIVETLAEKGPMGRRKLAEETGRELTYTSNMLSRLKKDGKVTNTGSGVWELVDDD